jgi:hypothetical protein
MKFVCGVGWADDFINCVEQDSTGNAAAAGVALNKITEVIDIDICIA